MQPRRALTWLGLALGIAGLVLQFVITMQAYLDAGRDVPGALGQFFSYYTILTNIVLVLIYLSEAVSARWLEFFRHPVTRGAMAANIALVGIYVALVLSHIYALEGLFLVADYMLHYFTPVIYLAWWMLGPHGALNWRLLPLMLAPTFLYFLYAMARGAWVGEYPYPILDAIELGYGQVLVNALTMTLGLGVLMALVIGADLLLSRNSRKPA